MTSSGFPSVLCYSELLRLHSYSSSPPLLSAPPPPDPTSQPPLTCTRLSCSCFAPSLMLRCHRARRSHTPRVFASVSGVVGVGGGGVVEAGVMYSSVLEFKRNHFAEKYFSRDMMQVRRKDVRAEVCWRKTATYRK